jgi:hypothetical protein
MDPVALIGTAVAAVPGGVCQSEEVEVKSAFDRNVRGITGVQREGEK